MNALFQITAVNAGSAVFLAIVAGIVGRYVRRPAVVHVLWLVVLLQLFMPPVLEIGVLPQLPITPVAAGTTEQVQPAGVLPVRDDSSVPQRQMAPSSTVSLAAVAVTLWLLGASFVFVLALVRAICFRRLIRIAETPDPGLESRVLRLARRMGVRAPRLRLVRAPISPLIWPCLSGPELLFPSGLLSRLSPTETDALLAHELAHVARRDHWVRLLELIAVSLFWWHPVVWWARLRLRMAEELCCDQRVMRVMQRQRPSYARGLLKTVEFLSGTGRRVPALASGIGEVRDLEDRLTMIMKDRPPKSLSTPRRVALALCAVAALLVFPTWTDRGTDAATPDVEASDQAVLDSLLELERKALELELALREVREQKRALEQEWNLTGSSSELARVAAETARVEALGARDEAIALRERAEVLEREFAREARRTALERQLQELEINREMEAQQFERQLAEAQLDRLRNEVAAHREAGHERRADELEDEARGMLEELRWEREQQAREIDMLREAREIEELSRRIRSLEAEGRDEEARELIERRDDLERSLDRERSH